MYFCILIHIFSINTMKKRITKKKEHVSDVEALEELSENTKEGLLINRIALKNSSKNPDIIKKYSRKSRDIVEKFVNGYDLLQYMIVVKPYIMKKYKIEKSIELEALLYLFPIQFFTLNDFKLLGLKQYNLHIKTLEDIGYLKLCVTRTDGRKVYTLTEKSVNIVTDFYKYLSGEKGISLNNDNPFRGEGSAKIDKLRERVMLQLKTQVQKNPNKFKGKLY